MKSLLKTIWSAVLVTVFIAPMFVVFCWMWAGLGLLEYVERRAK